MRRRRVMRWPGLAFVCVALLAACARGPDETAVRDEVRDKLAKQVKEGLLEVTSLGRKGSAPLPAGETGAKRLVVYYNASLRFLEDYDFGGWDKLSPASLAFALGATEKGLLGIKPRNRAGDVVYVYGTSTYEWVDGAWKTVAQAPGDPVTAPDRDNSAPPSQSKQLIDKLAAMVNLPPPGIDPRHEEVIADELNRAAESIQRRLARRRHVYTFASGPRGGEYERFGSALVERLTKTRPELAVRHIQTEGSAENAALLARGEADYAIVQADVAAEALAGRGAFARLGPATTLRALGSLFPDAVHVIVPVTSPIRSIEELRGKRVDIGAPSSGTRFSAIAVLAAHGLGVRDLGEAVEGGRDAAADRLAAGKLDAFFMTIAPPARALQALAVRPGMRLLPLRSRSVERLVAEHTGLVAITIPARTYPGQHEPVATVATAALLVTTSEAPEAEVADMATFVFSRAEFAAAGNPEGVKVSRDTALRGITLPMHPGTSRVFAARP